MSVQDLHHQLILQSRETIHFKEPFKNPPPNYVPGVMSRVQR